MLNNSAFNLIISLLLVSQPTSDVWTQKGSTWANNWGPNGLPKRDPSRSVHPLHLGAKWAAPDASWATHSGPILSAYSTNSILLGLYFGPKWAGRNIVAVAQLPI